jgi:hypothetical protein
MEKIENDINLTNNEVKDILGTPPKWILRWGNLLLLLIIIIVMTGSIFIRRPEMIVGNIEIMPLKKEVGISVPFNTMIDTVLINDGVFVKQGERLLRYRNGNNLCTVMAPIAGYATVTQLLSRNILIDRDSTIINIDPSNQEYAVKGTFPGTAITKIYPGQSLQININNYPKEDFGSLIATVITKPVLDSLGNALITIQLNNNTTDHGKILPIRTLARGTGYTMVSNKRLIMWLLSK